MGIQKHFLKVKLIDDLTKNEKEDGYHVVRELFSKYPFMVDHINQKKYNSACADLIHKYENNWAAWNLIEVISFGDFIRLYEFYYLLYPEQDNEIVSDLIWSLKFIRNASAHNNCLLNTLRKPYAYTHLYDKKKKAIIVNKSLISLLSSVPSITKKNRKKRCLILLFMILWQVYFCLMKYVQVKYSRRRYLQNLKIL